MILEHRIRPTKIDSGIVLFVGLCWIIYVPGIHIIVKMEWRSFKR